MYCRVIPLLFNICRGWQNQHACFAFLVPTVMTVIREFPSLLLTLLLMSPSLRITYLVEIEIFLLKVL